MNDEKNIVSEGLTSLTWVKELNEIPENKITDKSKIVYVKAKSSKWEDTCWNMSERRQESKRTRICKDELYRHDWRFLLTLKDHA